MAFLVQLLIFPPKNRFSRQKVQKNWKSKNGVKTALTPLFKELWAIFGVKNTLVNPSIFPIFERDFGRILDILPYYTDCFLVKFWIFSPKNRFSSQKVQKNWKSKNGVKTALTPLFKELWAIFGFVKFKNQISPHKNRKSFDDLQIFNRKSGHFLPFTGSKIQ